MLITVIIIFIVYILYYIISISRFDRAGHSKKSEATDYQALPAEVKYFIRKYNVDEEKVNYRGVLKLIGLVLGIDIAIVVIPTLLFINNDIIQVIVATLLLMPIFLLSLKIIGNYFKKKGLVKDV